MGCHVVRALHCARRSRARAGARERGFECARWLAGRDRTRRSPVFRFDRARRERMQRGLSRRRRLSAMADRPGADVCDQRRRHRACHSRCNRCGSFADRLHQHGRRARDSARRRGTRRYAVVARHDARSLQAIEVHGGAGGARGRARGRAGRDRKSVDADWCARLQADADRPNHRGFPESADACVRRDRAQYRRRRRCRARSSAGGRAGPNR